MCVAAGKTTAGDRPGECLASGQTRALESGNDEADKTRDSIDSGHRALRPVPDHGLSASTGQIRN